LPRVNQIGVRFAQPLSNIKSITAALVRSVFVSVPAEFMHLNYRYTFEITTNTILQIFF